MTERKRGESPTSPRRIEQNGRHLKALELRIAGMTYEVIAQQLDYANHSGAVLAVKSALSKRSQHRADEAYDVSAEQLSKIVQVQWPSVLRGDIAATETCMRAIKHYRDLLGTDRPPPPQRHWVSGDEGGPIQTKQEIVVLLGKLERLAGDQALPEDGIP